MNADNYTQSISNASAWSWNVRTSSEHDFSVSRQRMNTHQSGGSDSASQSGSIASHSAETQKHKSFSRNSYRKAMFILNKISQNELEGRFSEKDQQDKVKYLAEIEEYKQWLANRGPEVQAPITNHAMSERVKTETPASTSAASCQSYNNSHGTWTYHDNATTKDNKTKISDLISNNNTQSINNTVASPYNDRISSERNFSVSSQRMITHQLGGSGSASQSGSIASPKVETQKHKHGRSMHQRYEKAMFMLDKISKNELEGRFHERDEEDKVKYLAEVEEYKQWLANRVPVAQTTKRNHAMSDSLDMLKRAKTEISASTPAALRQSHKNGHETQTHKDIPSRDSIEEVITGKPLNNDHATTKDNIVLALIDDITKSSDPISKIWLEIEAKLAQTVMDWCVEYPNNTIPIFDSTDDCQGYKLIKCRNEFSKDFLVRAVAEISEAWPGFRLKAISAGEVLRKPRIHIWLPFVKCDGDKLFCCLKLQNPSLPMDDWELINIQEHKKNNISILFQINQASADMIKKAEYKLNFGIGQARVKLFGQ